MPVDTTDTTPAAATADSDGALDAIRRRDELLSLLYWLRADRLNEAPDAGELAAFMGAVPVLAEDLTALVAAGLVGVPDGGAESGPRYQLTEYGIAEGKRRFDEEFSALPDDGTAGNAHEVIVGICGPNAKCVREGLHDDCAEPALAYAPPAQREAPAGALAAAPAGDGA